LNLSEEEKLEGIPAATQTKSKEQLKNKKKIVMIEQRGTRWISSRREVFFL
jgi:hypothetical protein